MLKRTLALTCILFHLYAQAHSMMVDPVRPLSGVSIVQELLNEVLQTVKEQPHKINETNKDGYTLLQQALINNALIEDKISQLKDTNGTEHDILNNSRVTVKILLNNGADPNILFPGDHSQRTNKPQHFLIKAAQPNATPLFPLHIISLLFEHGLDAQIGDAKGNTALLRLIPLLHVWRKIPEYRAGFIRLTVYYTNNFNIQNNEGNTALHLTSRFNDLETARLILQNPVRLDIRNGYGQTPRQVSQFMSSALLPEGKDLRWYWAFSFTSANYKMIKLLEEAEKFQLANGGPLHKEKPIHNEKPVHSTAEDSEKNTFISHCRRVFSFIKAPK